MNSKQLRKIKPEKGQLGNIKRNPIYLVCDNVLDTYNIGSIFRLADAIAAEKVYLCGGTEYPPNSRIHKAAVGTEEWVAWEMNPSTVEAIRKLKGMGVQIICVEQSDGSIPFISLATKTMFPCAIVVGHETNGVSKEVLDLADMVVELPMFGINKSLNVWGAAAIVSYKIIEALMFKPFRKPNKV
jgi:23S rRNA (guanosine2251-2'-O)-methyltransferase